MAKEVEVSIKELEDLTEIINELLEVSKSIKFNLAIIKIKNKAMALSKDVRDAIATHRDKIVEFENKKRNIIMQYAQMDDKGNAITNERGELLQDPNKDVNKLRDDLLEFEEANSETVSIIKDFEKAMLEKNSFSYEPIAIETIPDNVVSGKYLEQILKYSDQGE